MPSTDRDLMLELPDGDITSANAAGLSGKLCQMSNDAVCSDTEDIISIHDRKLDALEDLIESANGKPMLVAYWFRHDLERITQRLNNIRILYSRLDSSDSIKRWNNGKLPVTD
jgi:hypothetical protein